MPREGIRFGALAPPLAEQLAGIGLPSHCLARWQRYAKALTLLDVGGVLSGAETRRARMRLLRSIEAEVHKATVA
jgi:hypothetical protein